MAEIRRISTKTVYRNRWMTVREDTISRESGASGLYGVVEKKDFAVIIPVADDELVVVEQYRYPVAGRWKELPQGSWNGKGHKSIAETAATELLEETGLIAKELLYIGEEFVAYGYSNQKYHIFIAKKLELTAPSPEAEEEGLIAERVKITDFERMIIDGEIQDSASVTAFFIARLKGYL